MDRCGEAHSVCARARAFVRVERWHTKAPAPVEAETSAEPPRVRGHRIYRLFTVYRLLSGTCLRNTGA